MQSINRYMMKKNKKGQVLNIVAGTVIGFMILIFMIFAVLYGIAVLNPQSFFTTASYEQNATKELQQNLTSGVSKFANFIPIVMLVLGVVTALAGILLLILYVSRMKATGGTGGI